ncbi:hypothetical protein AB5J72_00860 [Streptomyces sp. CG1]|uniref:hypothetical protein n=1 Tax=Streptomyces sp. CG1 TaxID=1287523 RepID=UPI0034E21594
MTSTLVDTEMPLVTWPARSLDDCCTTGEESAREDERIRQRTAEGARNLAKWRRERLQKVQEYLTDSEQRLEEELQRVNDEIAVGPPPPDRMGW